MAIRKILTAPDETLKKKCKEVKVIDENTWTLLDDMYETMLNGDGVGLAAPQIGVLKRIVVIEVNNIKLELVNPQIIAKSGEIVDVEACLSVKGVQGYVKRPEKVTVTALDRFGNRFEFTGRGLMAKCICHECDHLDGILFTDIMIEPYTNKTTKKGGKK